jgi:hypothetical protein
LNRQGRELDRVLIVGIIALAGLTIAIVAWMGLSKFSPRERHFSSGFTNHVIAIELVRTREEVLGIVGEPGDPNREVMRGKVWKDFFFIPSYAVLFAALGWLLGRSNYRFAIWVGAAIVACSAGAAVFDVIENLRILHVLDARLADTTQTMLDRLRSASLVKWAFVFIAMALLAPIAFLRRELFTLPIGPPRLAAVLSVILALAYLSAGVIGLIGLTQYPLIERASIFMALALLLTVLVLLRTVFTRSRPPIISCEGA